jgi:hypothetical protein
MEIGIDSFGAVISDPATDLTLSPVQCTQNLLEEIVLADKVGLDIFGVANTIAASLWIQPRWCSRRGRCANSEHSPDQRCNRSERSRSGSSRSLRLWT